MNDLCVINLHQGYEIASVCLSLNKVTQKVVNFSEFLGSAGIRTGLNNVINDMCH